MTVWITVIPFHSNSPISVPGLPGPNYGMLGGGGGMLNPYPGMIPGQDLAHMGMGAAFDLAPYNAQLMAQYQANIDQNQDQK